MGSYEVGSIVRVIDHVTEDRYNIATVKLIEPDEQFPDIFYMYLVANDMALNDKYDPRIGNFWDIRTMNSPYVSLISPPV